MKNWMDICPLGWFRVSCHVNMSKIFPYYYAHKVGGFVWKITVLLTLKFISGRAIQCVILAKINSIGEVSRLLWKVLEHRFFRVPAEYQFSYHNDTTFYYFTAIRKTYLLKHLIFFHLQSESKLFYWRHYLQI